MIPGVGGVPPRVGKAHRLWPCWECTPQIIGRNSAAAFPANAENSAQAPFLPPLPTGPASLGSGGGPFSARRKRENPPEGPLAASRLTLAGPCTVHRAPLAALPLRDAASPLREKRKRRFWQLRKFSALIEGCAGNLMRGRKDVLLFPRFAHGRAYVEKYAVLL